MINIKDGNGIKLVLVDNVEIIESNEYVYTFEVPGVHNYISDNIISHNASTWNYVASNISPGFQYLKTGASGVTISMNITSSVEVKFRYSVRFYGWSGARYNIGSPINSYTTTYLSHTVGPTFVTRTAFDTSLSISLPSNFVEIKAGGIQVVSDPDVWVRIPRKPPGSSNPEVFTASGGTSFFKALTPNSTPYPAAINVEGDIMPYADSIYDLGSSGTQFASLNGVSINSFDKRIVKAVARVTGRNTNGAASVSQPSYNISSVSRNSAGVYTITLSDTISSGNAAPFVSAYGLVGDAESATPSDAEFSRNQAVKVSGTQFITGFKDNDVNTAQDPLEFYFVVYGAE
jgi:hypothetical protein